MKSQLLARTAFIPAAVASLAFSLALFGLMYSVIQAGQTILQERDVLPTIDFVRLKRDSSVDTISRNKPPPPPPAPPPPKKMKVASVAPSNSMAGMDMPSLDLNANLGGQALKGNKAAIQLMKMPIEVALPTPILFMILEAIGKIIKTPSERKKMAIPSVALFIPRSALTEGI